MNKSTLTIRVLLALSCLALPACGGEEPAMKNEPAGLAPRNSNAATANTAATNSAADSNRFKTGAAERGLAPAEKINTNSPGGPRRPDEKINANSPGGPRITNNR